MKGRYFLATRNQAWVCVHPHSPEPSRGDTVIGATVNQTGALTMGAARVGRDTVLGQIVREVQQAQASRAPTPWFAIVMASHTNARRLVGWARWVAGG